MDYLAHLINMVAIYAILAYSLNLITGYGGLLNICHAGFYGIGAYAYALSTSGYEGSVVAQRLTWTADWPLPFPWILAIAAPATLAWLTGMVTLRFRGDFFVFATLGLQMILFALLHNLTHLSNGPFGIYGIPPIEIFGVKIKTPIHALPFYGTIAILSFLALKRLFRSSFGLSLIALREDSLAASSIGIEAKRQFLRAFILSAAFAGIAGAMFAAYIRFIDPSSFNLKESIFILTILLLGGSGNLKGPIIGVAIMISLPEALRFLGLPDSIAANAREIIYGITLAALMYFRPQGIGGYYKV